MAGHETTANFALGTLGLLRHPDQLAELQQTALVAATVEENLRYLTIVHNGRSRVALADIELMAPPSRQPELPSSSPSTPPTATEPCSPTAANSTSTAIPAGTSRSVRRAPVSRPANGQGGTHKSSTASWSATSRPLRLATDFAQVPFRRDASVYGVCGLPVTWS